MCKYSISDTRLDRLRTDVEGRLSSARFEHTLGVERAAAWAGERLCPDDVPMLRAAALLHDVTKEYSFGKQLKICDERGIILREDEKNSPQTLHAITAAAIIPSEYPEFDIPELVGAVRWHTTGRAGMTLSEKIIFLADYIEDGRKYDSCRALRESFMRELSEAYNADGGCASNEMKSPATRLNTCNVSAESSIRAKLGPPHVAARPASRLVACLDRAVLAELRGTLCSLDERNLPVNADTLKAEAFIAAKLRG